MLSFYVSSRVFVGPSRISYICLFLNSSGQTPHLFAQNAPIILDGIFLDVYQ